MNWLPLWLPGDGHLFHGGLPGRQVGELLKPSSETGKILALGGCQQEKVFFTSRLEVAVYFARLRRGFVYLVEPVGDIAVDPVNIRFHLMRYPASDQAKPAMRTFRPSLFCAKTARVLEVVGSEAPRQGNRRIAANPT